MEAREINTVERLDAEFEAPPSKAFTLRALFIAALAAGESVIKNALNADDQQVAAGTLRQFGAGIRFDGKNFFVKGTGGKLKTPNRIVFTGESGVTTRFVLPLAALAKGRVTIDGSERMRERPVKGLVAALGELGVKAECSDSVGLPLSIAGGNFAGGAAGISGSVSSQFLSALLIAAPYTQKGILASVKGSLNSKPYVDITIECMNAFGVPVVNRDYKEFFVRGNRVYKGREYEIEGDYTSASYFFSAAAITMGRVRVKNLKPESVQGDRFFLEILEKMGCKVSFGGDAVEVRGGKLIGVRVDMRDYPDLVPSLAIAAAFADGKTEITNISHLRGKESDRIGSIAGNLRACGVPCIARQDSLEIVGGSRLHGADIETFNDHRIAMAFSVMGLKVRGIRILNPGVVGKSYPHFFAELEKAYA